MEDVLWLGTGELSPSLAPELPIFEQFRQDSTGEPEIYRAALPKLKMLGERLEARLEERKAWAALEESSPAACRLREALEECELTRAEFGLVRQTILAAGPDRRDELLQNWEDLFERLELGDLSKAQFIREKKELLERK